MIALLIAVAMPKDKVDGALDRYVAFMKANPSYSVDVRCTPLGMPESVGNLTVESGKRLLYNVKWGPQDYSLSITEQGTMELERGQRLYDEHSGQTQLRLYESRLSSAPTTTFPVMLLTPDLRRLVPKEFKFQYKGREKVGGIEADDLSGELKGDGGEMKLRLLIDDQGRLLRAERMSKSMMEGTSGATWVLSNFKPRRGLGVQAFLAPIPDGFTPYAFEAVEYPVQVGETPAFGTLTDPASGKTVQVSSLLGGKPGLVAVLGADSAPSREALTSVQRLEKSGMRVVRISDALNAAAAQGALFDPTGKLMGTIRPPATPFFMLLDASGKITHEWLGYDPEQGAKFEKEITDALKEQSATQ